MARRRNTRDIRWQVERERFQIEETYPPAPDNTAPISDIMPDVMKRMGLADAHWEDTVQREWTDLLGPQVAQHTRPGRLDYGTLIIYVKNSVWMQELRQMGERMILTRFQERFGTKKIKGIRLMLDPGD